MRKFFTTKKLNILASLTALLCMWLVWIIAAATVKNEYLIPPFSQSVEQFFTLFVTPFFWKAFGWTLLRTVIAFLISFAVAALCAAIAAYFKPFAAFLRPVVAVFRSLPTMAVLLLILVWTTPRTAPIVVAFLVLFPICYSQLTQGIAEVDTELLQMVKVYKVKPSKVITKVYLSRLAPTLVAQTGANLSFGIKLIISAEVMASTYTALGGMMSEAVIYSLPRLAALTLFAVLFGIAVELIFSLVAKYAFPWVRRCRNED
ncbi:MAG: ABC transporter permease subunit [Candidatus Coproplasma sp.]